MTVTHGEMLSNGTLMTQNTRNEPAMELRFFDFI